MSGGFVCKCPESKKPIEQRAWVIRDYKCNYSAFNGWRYTPSDYSAISCLKCQTIWRTKAKYVDNLKILSFKEQREQELKKEKK